MSNYIVYAVIPGNQSEIVVGSYEFKDQARAAIERYLNVHPTATCYINSDATGWVK